MIPAVERGAIEIRPIWELPAGYDAWPHEILEATAKGLDANPLPSG